LANVVGQILYLFETELFTLIDVGGARQRELE
jgi:hypothetical protein